MSAIHLSQPRATVQARLPDGRVFEAPPGTPLAEILRAAARPGEAPLAAAIVNRKLAELALPLTVDADVQPVTLAATDGMRIYRRSLVFLLVTAAKELYPEAGVFVEHAAAAAGAYFCEVRGRAPFTQDELDAIRARMRQMVAEDRPYRKSVVPLAEAIALFRARGEDDKVRLLAHRQKDTLVLYQLNGHADYLQGYMLPSTGYLTNFDLHAFPPGFLLQFPHQDTPTQLWPGAPYPKLFAVFEESSHWLDRLGIRGAGALNDAIAAGRLPEVSLVAEALHEGRLARIAAEIAAQHDRIRVVLIAGPSASGKTTFAKRLAIQLLAHGLHPYPLALDDYFVDRELTPRDAAGQFDYETLGALDVALFNEHLLALMAGQAVPLPQYNFRTGLREAGPTITLGRDDLLIIEGIHGLNPNLVPGLPPECIYRVYVSALTQLNLDRHNRVSTTDTRLIRRVARDAATRGYTAAQTLARWESVKRGEKLNIFPYQENSDAIFNSALVHEMAVLRPLAEPLLLQVRPDTPQYVEANRLLSFLQWFRPGPAAAVPDNSIMREFIGPHPTLLATWSWHDLRVKDEG
ncbi:MAG: nucleoside kinase [Anaerolineales bacterium]|nr:nucleoside kinase [Anaerolineales bacterium]